MRMSFSSGPSAPILQCRHLDLELHLRRHQPGHHHGRGGLDLAKRLAQRRGDLVLHGGVGDGVLDPHDILKREPGLAHRLGDRLEAVARLFKVIT